MHTISERSEPTVCSCHLRFGGCHVQFSVLLVSEYLRTPKLLGASMDGVYLLPPPKYPRIPKLLGYCDRLQPPIQATRHPNCL